MRIQGRLLKGNYMEIRLWQENRRLQLEKEKGHSKRKEHLYKGIGGMK